MLTLVNAAELAKEVMVMLVVLFKIYAAKALLNVNPIAITDAWLWFDAVEFDVNGSPLINKSPVPVCPVHATRK